jgi:two-component system chemotaxis response regulator CheY
MPPKPSTKGSVIDAPLKPSIVVVDDDRMTMELLKFILRSEEYRVIGQATNGADAVVLCVERKPDIVLLDINMPKMDGIQALEEIRKASPEVMVLMVSADSTMEKVKEALEKGAVGFVVKPLKPASVLDKIRDCLKAKKEAVTVKKQPE